MWIDIVLLALVGLGFWAGFSRGIIKTVFTVVSIALGVLAAIRFSPSMTNFLKDITNEHSPLMFFAGVILSFTITMLFIRLIGRGLEGMLQTANINIINRMAGGALIGAVTTFFYAALLSFFISSNPQTEAEITKDSVTYPYLKEYPAIGWQFAGQLKEPIQRFWSYAQDMMDSVEDFTEQTESENYFYDIEDNEPTPEENNPRPNN